jgi:RNase H-like domain found in reverse transcriptase/Integrase zinc binding domain
VTTDASDFGIGGVVEQEFDDGAHPIAYVSHKLNVPERNYPTHDRELLAIVHVVKKWCCYLHGSASIVRTYPHPLRYLETQPHLSKRQVRWFDTIAEHDFKIEADPTYQKEYRLPQQLIKKEGLLFDKKGRLCVQDGSTRLALMHDSRDSIIFGHLGVAKTINRLRGNFTWPLMHAQVTTDVTTCHRCQRDRSPNRRPSGLLQPLEVPDEPYARVFLDFVMALPPSNGFDAILVVVNKLSRSIVLTPLGRPSPPRKQPAFTSTMFIVVMA